MVQAQDAMVSVASTRSWPTSVDTGSRMSEKSFSTAMRTPHTSQTRMTPFSTSMKWTLQRRTRRGQRSVHLVGATANGLTRLQFLQHQHGGDAVTQVYLWAAFKSWRTASKCGFMYVQYVTLLHVCGATMKACKLRAQRPSMQVFTEG